MNPLPRITIITPSFNQAAFIEQTIQSVLNQDYPDLEYLVLDGGSSDGTLEILKKYESRLIWSSGRDRGQAHAINQGMEMATGEVIGYLNSDDIFEPGALRYVGRFFADHSEMNWITGRCRMIDGRGMEVRKAVTRYKNFWLRQSRYSILLVLNYISQPATFWRVRIFREIGPFRESLHYAMDYDYWLRIWQKYPLKFLDWNLSCFRVHHQSKTGTTSTGQFDEMLEIAQLYIRNPVLLSLHKLHRIIEVYFYSRWMKNRKRTEAQSRLTGEG